jgi:hypothetical protein
LGYSWGLRSSAAIRIGRLKGEPNIEKLTFRPLIILEEHFEYKVKSSINAILDGYHRWKACLKYNETRAERLAALKEDETIPDPFETVPCEYHQIPPGVPVKLYAGSLSCKHGLRWADGDKKATAREVYSPFRKLSRACGRTDSTSIIDLLRLHCP